MEHGLLMLSAADLSLGRPLVPGDGWRLHLDGALLPTMVWSARENSGKYLIYKIGTGIRGDELR